MIVIGRRISNVGQRHSHRITFKMSGKRAANVVLVQDTSPDQVQHANRHGACDALHSIIESQQLEMLDLGFKERLSTCALPHGRMPHVKHFTIRARAAELRTYIPAHALSSIEEQNALPCDHGPGATFKIIKFELLLLDAVNITG